MNARNAFTGRAVGAAEECKAKARECGLRTIYDRTGLNIDEPE